MSDPAIDSEVQARIRRGSSQVAGLDDLIDRAAVIDMMARYALCLDTRDWVGYRQLFADVIALDFRLVNGNPPSVIDADTYVGSAQAGLGGLAATQHIITNHLVSFGPAAEGAREGARPSAADCVCNLQAQHYLPNAKGADSLKLGGRYTVHMVRISEDEPWHIDRLGLEVLWNEGNWHVFQLARDLAAARHAEPSAS